MLSSTSADSNDALARLLATANGALDTDLRAAKSCIQRAAALLGINLSAERSGAAGYSYLQGGLAPWQAKRIRVYIEEQLGSSIRVADLAEMVQLSTSHFFSRLSEVLRRAPHHLHHAPTHPASPGIDGGVAGTPIAGGPRVRFVRSSSSLPLLSSDRRNQPGRLAASISCESSNRRLRRQTRRCSDSGWANLTEQPRSGEIHLGSKPADIWLSRLKLSLEDFL